MKPTPSAELVNVCRKPFPACKLHKDAYTAVIYVPWALSGVRQRTSGCLGACCWSWLWFGCILAWLGSIGLQMLFIYYVAWEVASNADELCVGGAHTLRVACIGVLVAKVFGGELGQTCNLYRWCMLVSDPQERSDLEAPSQPGCYYEKRTEEGVDVFRVGTVMPAWLFRFSMLVVLTKALTALVSLYVSVGFVMASEANEDLILNCLATVFVLELDDIGFDMLVPYALKQSLDNHPALTPREGHWMYTSANIDVVFASFGLFVLFGLATAHMHFHWCEDWSNLFFFSIWLVVPLLSWGIHCFAAHKPSAASTDDEVPIAAPATPGSLRAAGGSTSSSPSMWRAASKGSAGERWSTSSQASTMCSGTPWPVASTGSQGSPRTGGPKLSPSGELADLVGLRPVDLEALRAGDDATEDI